MAATSGEVTAAGTLWVRPEHVGSMATTTTDDILMVYGDGAEGVVRVVRDAAGTRTRVADRRMIDRRTQHHPLSAAIDNRRSGRQPSAMPHAGPSSIVRAADGVGERDSSADG